MNKALLILSLAFALFIVSCDKESAGTINDFSNVANPYAALASTDKIEANEGDTVGIDFVIRTAFSKADQDVTITYNVSGAMSLTDQTIVIPRTELSATFPLVIPDDLITDPDPDATDTITVSMTKAVVSDGTALRVGLKDDPSTQQVKVIVYKP